ncbi:hypothetical protein BKA66DRAFT_422764 [Pyrenochaeta sp. MPI-SDFR-AT-0127]|nr:hypothetical protein BKA66DRAFT_422764 [Pyrenochaeta sp. MPI-SDFR-AT-0127]
MLAIAFLLCGLCAADVVDNLQAIGRPAMNAAIANSSTCTKQNLRVRREWGDITATNKKAYIAAVLCLTKSSSRLNATEYPGAKTRYDDFVALHMKYSLTVHNTGNFLSWHRYFTYAYEEALRVECGYNGTQPYWNWGRYANPETSPLFDGSETSLSGQGGNVTHVGNGLKPPGQGGGCITTGPFKDMKVNLGPLALQADVTDPIKNPQANGFGYNPRCIKRDISGFLVQRDATPLKIATLIINNTAIGPFQETMQAPQGVHTAGHFTVSGDPGSDFYTSPGDPYFFLHHAMIDRVWYIWQSLEFGNRQQVIAGGTNFTGGGHPQRLDDVQDLEVLNVGGKAYPIKELVSTVAGPFCYIYE